MKFLEVLQEAYLRPFYLQSELARREAQNVAKLASLNLITTQESPGVHGKQWRITLAGLQRLHDEGLV
jgi:hypothetical protein